MEITVQDLHKSFNDQAVLNGVSLSIPSGRITVIIGGSGEGKSVFLKHLIGLIRPDAGSIKVDGQEITKLHEREMMPLRRRIGYIFQQGALLASISVGENVALGLVENRMATREEAAATAREMLALVGMDGQFDALPETLSGGMRKRVALARALTMKPECILYDEPTAGLDPPRSRQVENLIQDVNGRLGVTSVVVTHDMATVHRIADLVYMLHEGRITFSGTPEGLQASQDPTIREFIEC